MIALCWFTTLLVSVLGLVQAQQEIPQLNGQHFRITALEEFGFLDVETLPNGTLSYSGYLIDIIKGLAKRANFTYDIAPPSGLGSHCTPRVSADDVATNNNATSLYDPVFRTQYNCGADDVNERHDGNGATVPPPSDMYLGMYYITPTRQLQNQFTIPLSPPFGGLAMLGTATRIPNFSSLLAATTERNVNVCAPQGTALLEFVEDSYPGLQVDGLLLTNNEESILEALQDGTCQVYVVDGPVATQFVLRRSKEGRCKAENDQPIGLIGEPMQFGLSQYAIGIRQDIPIEVERTLSYWLNVLMTCNPLDADGECPEGNLASFYEGHGGTGDECGYVLNPPIPTPPNAPMIFGVVLATVVCLVALGYVFLRYRLHRQARLYNKRARAVMAQAEREREFTDVLAHEIRNPLASAIAALNFVFSKAEDPAVIPSSENRVAIRSDIAVIESSLQFVNDLLRNMLDLHRSSSKQLKLDLAPTDILRDVFEPVASILFLRGTKVEIRIDVSSPKNLTVQTDRMRLKQIVLNLAINSTKFVESGFIQLRATNIDGNVHVFVEDSGPGIPVEKRERLFAKFQESLDSLNQGTGIGLSLCKSLSEVMGADLFLDEGFDSGVPDFPGTRFTLRMNKPPLVVDLPEQKGPDECTAELSVNLPLDLSVLFVDDDTIVRKMFSRTIQRVAPTWDIHEASNGETAIRIAEKSQFDLIFIDQYMASVDKQYLGTETVQVLRARGVQSVICGISANDKGQQFLDAGADGFLFKPFPCQKDALKNELHRLLTAGSHRHRPEECV